MATPSDVLAQAARLRSGTRFERARAGATALSTFLQLTPDDKRNLAVMVAQRVAPELVPRIQAEARHRPDCRTVTGSPGHDRTAGRRRPARVDRVDGDASRPDAPRSARWRALPQRPPGSTTWLPRTPPPHAVPVVRPPLPRPSPGPWSRPPTTQRRRMPTTSVRPPRPQWPAASPTSRPAWRQPRPGHERASSPWSTPAPRSPAPRSAPQQSRSRLRDAASEADIARRAHEGELDELRRQLRRSRREVEEAGGGSVSSAAIAARPATRVARVSAFTSQPSFDPVLDGMLDPSGPLGEHGAGVSDVVVAGRCRAAVPPARRWRHPRDRSATWWRYWRPARTPPPCAPSGHGFPTWQRRRQATGSASSRPSRMAGLAGAPCSAWSRRASPRRRMPPPCACSNAPVTRCSPPLRCSMRVFDAATDRRPRLARPRTGACNAAVASCPSGPGSGPDVDPQSDTSTTARSTPCPTTDFHPATGLQRRSGRLKQSWYEEELGRLQEELVKLQHWVQHEGIRALVIFEGRGIGWQGRRHQAHPGTHQPPHGAGGGTAQADRAGTDPVVLPALRRTPAGRRRDRAVRSQLVQPLQRRVGHGLLHRPAAPRVPALVPGVRTDAGAVRHQV